MIRAEWWVWGLYEKRRAGHEPICLGALDGGADEGHLPPTFRVLRFRDSAPLKLSFFVELQRRHACPSRMPKEGQMKNEHAECDSRLLHSDDGDVPGILSRRAAGLNSFSVIGLYRSPEQPPFAPHELRLAEIVLTEVSWLHEKGWPAAPEAASSLPSRQRQALNLLIRGHSRKEIAHRLRISLSPAMHPRAAVMCRSVRKDLVFSGRTRRLPPLPGASG